MNHHVKLDNVLSSFMSRMHEKGIYYDGDLIIEGAFYRFHIDGDKPNSKNGWYVLNELNGVLFGSFGCFKRGISENWKQENTDPNSCRAHNQLVIAENKKQVEEKHSKASQAANELWNNADQVKSHPYLRAKKVLPYGLRVNSGVLYVPLRDIHGTLWSIERIYPDGTKKRLPNARSKGCFHILGEIKNKVIIAEGYSTAASLYQASGVCTVAAFSVSGLMPIAVEFRKYFPKLEIIIAADDDYNSELKNNLGLVTAIDVARIINGKYITPKFKSRSRMKCDFNDILVVDGIDCLKKYLEGVL